MRRSILDDLIEALDSSCECVSANQRIADKLITPEFKSKMGEIKKMHPHECKLVDIATNNFKSTVEKALNEFTPIIGLCSEPVQDYLLEGIRVLTASLHESSKLYVEDARKHRKSCEEKVKDSLKNECQTVRH